MYVQIFLFLVVLTHMIDTIVVKFGTIHVGCNKASLIILTDCFYFIIQTLPTM